MVNITPAFWLVLFILEDGYEISYLLAKNDEISLVIPGWHYEEDLFEIVLNNTASMVGEGAIFFQMVEIHKEYIFSEEGKYKYVNIYMIKMIEVLVNE